MISNDITKVKVESTIVPIVILFLQHSLTFGINANKLTAITEADSIATAAVELTRLRFILLAAIKRAFRVSHTFSDNSFKYIILSLGKEHPHA